MIHRSLVALGLCVACLPWPAASAAQAPRVNSHRAEVEKLNRAMGLYQAGKYREAARLLQEIYPVDLMSREVMWLYARAHFKLGHLDTAEQLFRRVVAGNRQLLEGEPVTEPEREAVFDARVQLGVIYLQRGQWEEALQSYREAAALKYEAARPHRVIGLILLDHYQRPEEALDHLKTALSLDPSSEETKRDLARCLGLAGDLAAKSGDRPKAEAYYRRALTYQPGWPEMTIKLDSLLHPDQEDEPVAAPAPAAGAPTGHVAEFFSAVALAEPGQAKAMLAAEPALAKAVDGRGLSALCSTSSPELAELLITAGADLKAATFAGRTPLHWAVMQPTADVARVLLAHGADTETPDQNGQLPLHTAVAECLGPTDAIECLLLHGARVYAHDRSGATPLTLAAQRGSTDVIDLFVAFGADLKVKDSQGLTAVEVAAKAGHAENVEQLSALAAIGQRPGEVILKAVRAHDTASVGKLLAARSSLATARDPFDGRTLLHVAAGSGFDDLVTALLAAHANVQAVDRIGRTPLHYAVEAGHLETTKLLLAAGADVAVAGDGGWTPLKLAAAGDGENPCGPMLLEAKANPNDAGMEGGDTPLEMAAMNNHVGLVTALLQHGANPKFATKDGRTALHGAQPACAELLIARGADVNALGPEGTPLHCRVNQEDLAGVELLVAHGANVNATNQEGRTPLDLAREGAKGAEGDPDRVARSQKVIDFLLGHGAKPGKPAGA